MPHINSRRKPMATAALFLLVTCLGLAACGSSSKSPSTTASTAASTSTAGGAATAPGSAGTTPAGRGKGGAFGKRFAAIRECLQKNGVTLPQRTPGQRRPGGGAGGFLGGAAGAPPLPKGVTRAQYEAALKKCGGNFAGAGAGAARFKSPAYKAALTKFASCLRENGVKLPAPNTSGTGPIFNTKGINTASAQFKAAESKCSSVLRGAFRGGAGGPGPRGTGAGGSPAGGTQPPA